MAETRQCPAITTQKIRSLNLEIQNYYEEQWTNAWTIPAKHYPCAASSACVETDISQLLQRNKILARKASRFIERVLKTCSTTKKIRRLVRKARNARRAVDAIIAETPTTVVSCQ